MYDINKMYKICITAHLVVDQLLILFVQKTFLLRFEFFRHHFTFVSTTPESLCIMYLQLHDVRCLFVFWLVTRLDFHYLFPSGLSFTSPYPSPYSLPIPFHILAKVLCLCLSVLFSVCLLPSFCLGLFICLSDCLWLTARCFNNLIKFFHSPLNVYAYVCVCVCVWYVRHFDCYFGHLA